VDGTPASTSARDLYENRAGSTSLFGVGHVTADGRQERAEQSGIELFLSSFGPRSWSQIRGGRRKILANHCSTPVLLGRNAVHCLDGLWELIAGDLPDPGSTVARHRYPWRSAEVAARGFAPGALTERRTLGRDVPCGGILPSCGLRD
jgi:hypothetical protein